MSIDDLAEELVGGPRGRRMLAELAAATVDGVDPWAWPAWGHDELAPLPEALRQELVGRLEQALSGLDLDAVARREDPREFLLALAESVGAARYWQQPDLVDVALADSAVGSLLRPLAQAVAGAPATSWWSHPVDLGVQQHLQWLFEPRDRYHPVVVGAGGAVSALARWRQEADQDEERCRRERPREVGANWSGTWWSSPPPLPELLLTTPLLAGQVREEMPAEVPVGLPVGMALVEDDMGIEEVRARAVRLRAGVRVYEVHDAAAWCDLVAAHPRSVTFSRRHDWWRATGWDGSWVLPDWASVARHWDGVHLSVRGYLAVSGRLLPTPVSGQDAPGVRPGPAAGGVESGADVLAHRRRRGGRRGDGVALCGLPAGVDSRAGGGAGARVMCSRWPGCRRCRCRARAGGGGRSACGPSRPLNRGGNSISGGFGGSISSSCGVQHGDGSPPV